MPLRVILALIGLVTLACAAAVILPPLIRWRLAKRESPGEGGTGRRCFCGYLVEGLEIPRCPECGRMIGFDKTPAELGVTEEQMLAEAERRRATRGSAKIP